VNALFLLHGLLIVDLSGAIVPVLLVLWVAGTAFAAVALALSPGRGLWITTGLVLVALGVSAALIRSMDAAMLLGAIAGGVCAASGVVYWRVSRRQVPAAKRESRFVTSSPNSLVDAVIAGGAFAGAALGVFAAFVFALTL
jgi:hypothetical protein